MMSEILQTLPLRGCISKDLSTYLKALGIFRLVAEQKGQQEHRVQTYWEGETFCLRTTLSEEDIEHFFLHEYVFSPVIAPWSNGSGFYYKGEKGKKANVSNILIDIGTRKLEQAQAEEQGDQPKDRFSLLRQAVQTAREILIEDFNYEAASNGSLKGEAPEKGKKKEAFIEELRSRLPEAALSWLDTVLVMGAELKYPPLLGTGGNDGNLEFASHYLQHLNHLFDFKTGHPYDETPSLLRGALQGAPTPGFVDSKAGQFSPSSAGGVNTDTRTSVGDGMVNPWNFIFTMEGTLLLCGAISRRLDASNAGPRGSTLTYPFTVRTTGGGSGTLEVCDVAESRGELWLPIWSKPTGLDELRWLFQEGRLPVENRSARDGLDAVRAINGLGLSRGLTSFRRYLIARRHGKNHLAVLTGVFQVRQATRKDLIDDLEEKDWLHRFRKKAADSKQASGQLKELLRLLEDSLFHLAQREGDSDAVQAVLIVLGRIVRSTVLGTSPGERLKAREFPFLSKNWVLEANDKSNEFRIAAALAGLCMTSGESSSPDRSLPLCVHLAELEPTALITFSKRHRESEKQNSKGESSGWMRTLTWGDGSLSENLSMIAERRCLLRDHRQKQGGSRRDLSPWGTAGLVRADQAAIAGFLAGQTDDLHISRLVQGLVWVKWMMWADGMDPSRLALKKPLQPGALPFAYAALKPLFADPYILNKCLKNQKEPPYYPTQIPYCPTRIVELLKANRITEAVVQAMQRMRAFGFEVPFSDHFAGQASITGCSPGPLGGRRLLSALLIPVESSVLKTCLQHSYPATEQSTEPDTLGGPSHAA